MVNLYCAVVGEALDAILVSVDEHQRVGELKEVITTKLSKILKCTSSANVMLFQAKNGSTWLKEEEFVRIQERGTPGELDVYKTERLRFMTKRICDVFNSLPEETIHVLVVVSKPSQPQARQPQPKLWLFNGSIENALSNSITVIVLAGDCALAFENDIMDGIVRPGSPWYNLSVITKVTQVDAVSTELHRVFLTHYKPEESTSPPQTISVASSTESKVDLWTEDFEFQRIEDKTVFVPYSKADSCHLVSSQQCKEHNLEFGRYHGDPNNRLALSRELRGWYDGLSCDVPYVNMYPGAIEEKPSKGNRYKVNEFVVVLYARILTFACGG
ncbi:hypothetical protein PHMEG_00031295 [Phytophthora megakarya]|uniref:Crinkler effector protein N-terminal domain-containing protein n=1 Tax=Phytophthora megakarya TaxID=4795 RepID=A0A225UYE9_9STRA|nr:hypothetical protein PHMEG_00031295 [Phytophthora megakarya]